jgi:farnesyl diphosphate synthase
MLTYNVPGGKLNRGLTVVHTLESVLAGRGERASPAQVEGACVLGWCIEWLQASFLVADDIMDASTTRRGSPCWYKRPTIGMIAINDAFLLQSHMYRCLQRYFGGTPHYLALVELFNHTKWQTEVGQMLDLTTGPMPGAAEAPDLSRYTPARYALIVKHKTAYYSFYLPVMCGLVLAGVDSSRKRPLTSRILLTMGEYFQVQDDYLDAYAPPEVLGKVGTDIQDAKCGWLVVRALERASEAQRAVLQQHYGRHGEEDVRAVKALYLVLGLEEDFKAYEAQSYKALTEEIAQVKEAEGIPTEAFTSLLAKIYKRKM